MNKWAYLAGSCVLLAGCTTSKPVTLPDGTQGVMINCGGTANSFASCQMKAGEACPSGYTVVDADRERGVVSLPSEDGFDQVATASRSMMIKCNPVLQ